MSSQLTVEDYVSAIQVLVNDLRFNLYITLYKTFARNLDRIGFCCIAITSIFWGQRTATFCWGSTLARNQCVRNICVNVLQSESKTTIDSFIYFINFVITLIEKLYHLLERCISQVNAMLYKYNILLGVDDRGHISCHKIYLVFVYFDVSYCIVSQFL